MGLINFKDIDCNKSINKENKIINFNGSEIQILNYLPIRDKYDLIVISLQKSFENNIYNYHKLKMYFNLHLIYLYTNIVFDVEDRADEEGLYDILKRSGLLDAVVAEIDEKEKNNLWADLIAIKEDMEKYYSSFSGFLENALEDLEEKLKQGFDFIKSLDLKENPELLKIIKEIKNDNE